MKKKSIKKTPLVSIITINLNNAAGLRKTLESLAAQTWQNFESILVDGGSTDGSVEVIKEFLSTQQFQIGKWVSEKDKGLYHAQNKGINFSKGKYLLFLNSGDYLASDDVLKELKPEKWTTDMVYGNLLLSNGDTTQPLKPFKPPKEITILHLLMESLPHQTFFIQKKLFKTIGLYREDLRVYSDYHFFLNAIYNFQATLKYCDTAVTVYDTTGISGNKKFMYLRYRERKAVQKELLPPEAYAVIQHIDDHINHTNSFRFALLAIPRYFARRLRKFFYPS